DGALGRSKPGETGESGTESGSTAGDAAGDTRDLAPPADAWAAAARGGRAAAVSGSGARGAAIAATRASGGGAATAFGLGPQEGAGAARIVWRVIRAFMSGSSAPRITSAKGLGSCGST